MMSSGHGIPTTLRNSLPLWLPGDPHDGRKSKRPASAKPARQRAGVTGLWVTGVPVWGWGGGREVGGGHVGRCLERQRRASWSGSDQDILYMWVKWSEDK